MFLSKCINCKTHACNYGENKKKKLFHVFLQIP
jgi:hypothetical protein